MTTISISLELDETTRSGTVRRIQSTPAGARVTEFQVLGWYRSAKNGSVEVDVSFRVKSTPEAPPTDRR